MTLIISFSHLQYLKNSTLEGLITSSRQVPVDMFRSHALDYIYSFKFLSESVPTDVWESLLHLTETNKIKVSKTKEEKYFYPLYIAYFA